MQRDIIDDVLREWRSVRPNLDSRSLGVVGRILRMAGIFERRANAALKRYGLTIWAFDMLATLRRQGQPYSLTPTDLMRSTMLSSGAMTNRIDRLEEQGLVAREADPIDRRSLRVRLTATGLKTLDAAAAARFQESDGALRGASPAERKQLARLLRKVLRGVEGDDDVGKDAPPATARVKKNKA